MNESSLKALCSAIDKQFGKGAVMTLGEKPVFSAENTVKTGSISLDEALGIGGYPRGRIIEILGKESSGKSTCCLHACAEFQKLGLTCAYIDAEHALDPTYAEAIGVDTDALLISQPDYGEQALEIACMMAGSGAVELIIVDSVAALVPKVEVDGDMEAHFVGTQARMMGQALRKLTPLVHNSNCTIIFINQIRQMIGVLHGPTTTTAGGLALRHYASMRLETSRTGDATEGSGEDKEITGNKTKVKVIKNKCAAPKKEAYFNITFGIGIDPVIEVIDYGEIDGLIKKSGAWYSYEGNNIGQGLANTVEYLKTNPNVFEEIKGKILAKRGR